MAENAKDKRIAELEASLRFAQLERDNRTAAYEVGVKTIGQLKAERDQLAEVIYAWKTRYSDLNLHYETAARERDQLAASLRGVVKPEPGMKCGYCGERWPKPGHFDERGFCRSSREFGLEG